VLARLPVQRVPRVEQMPERGPGVGRAPGHFLVSEVTGGGATVPGRQLELRCRLLVELRGGLERLAQFQTLTSR
jgi:hypothetical protein